MSNCKLPRVTLGDMKWACDEGAWSHRYLVLKVFMANFAFRVSAWRFLTRCGIGKVFPVLMGLKKSIRVRDRHLYAQLSMIIW